MYIPNTNNVYGSDSRRIQLAFADKSYHADIDLSKSNLKALDLSNARCEKTTEKREISACIAKFVDANVGCKFPLFKSSSLNSKCNTSHQYLKLFELSERLQSASATEIYQMTGCLSSCKSDVYNIGNPLKKWIGLFGYKKMLQLRFILKTGTHMIVQTKLLCKWII
jgi:hypothetical protein